MVFASPQFEALGGLMRSYVDAFKLFPHVPQSILLKHGIGRLERGVYELDTSINYPFDKVLDALKEICALVGDKKIFEIGQEIIKNAVLPPGATDIVSAMKIFDAGYHLNHRRNGVPMFDVTKGTMLEGIGHYRCVSAEESRVVMELDVPFPCEFDRGIMQAWAQRFERSALVTHLEPKVCRNNGALKCRYEVTWK